MVTITTRITNSTVAQLLSLRATALGGRGAGHQGDCYVVQVPQPSAYEMRTYAATVGVVLQPPIRQAGKGAPPREMEWDNYLRKHIPYVEEP